MIREIIFIKNELKESLKKIEILIPQLMSAIIPIIVFIYGFSKLKMADYSLIITSGYLFSQLLSISTSAVIFLSIDLTISNIKFYFSLPFSSNKIIIMKFISSYLISYIIGFISFNIANSFLYKIFDTRILFIYIIIFIQTILLTSFYCVLLSLVKDISRIGLIISISSILFIYLSPVYFPVEIFPNLIRKLLIINPLYFPIIFLRNIISKNFIDFKILLIILFLALFYQVISFFILRNKIIKTL